MIGRSTCRFLLSVHILFACPKIRLVVFCSPYAVHPGLPRGRTRLLPAGEAQGAARATRCGAQNVRERGGRCQGRERLRLAGRAGRLWRVFAGLESAYLDPRICFLGCRGRSAAFVWASCIQWIDILYSVGRPRPSVSSSHLCISGGKRVNGSFLLLFHRACL